MSFFQQSRYKICHHRVENKPLPSKCVHRILLCLHFDRVGWRIGQEKIEEFGTECKELTAKMRFHIEGKVSQYQQDEKLARECVERQAQERAELAELFIDLEADKERKNTWIMKKMIVTAKEMLKEKNMQKPTRQT